MIKKYYFLTFCRDTVKLHHEIWDNLLTQMIKSDKIDPLYGVQINELKKILFPITHDII